MKGNLFCAIIFFILLFYVCNVLMAAVPTFNSVTTDDIDSDGQIDQLTIVFSENVDIGDPGGAGDGLDCLNVVGYTIAIGDHSGNDVPSLVVSLVESGSYDTDATPDVTYTQVNPSYIESVSTAEELAEGYTFNTTTDGASPVVRNVTSSNLDGTYTLTDLVVVVVEFSENVVVTGIPRIALNSGGIALYSSGTGSDTLNFNYTVGAGQNSADIDYSAINALTLAGGTINDGVGNNAVLTLPIPGGAGSLGQNKDIVIDTPPRVTNVTATNLNGYYNAGTNIDINIVFNESVSVAGGPPTLDLNSGGTAIYNGGTGTATLAFTYTVAGGENSADLDYTGTGALNLNGGTIRDIDGAADDANPTLPVPGAAGSLGANKNLIIDTVPPQMLTAVFLDVDGNDIDVGDYIIVGFDEPMRLNCANSSDFVLLNSAFGDTFGTGSSLIDDVPNDNFINIVLGNNPFLNLTDIWSAPGLDMPSGLGIRSGGTLCAADLANNSAPDGPEIDISGGGFNVIETVTVSDGANIYTNPDASSALLDVNISVTFDLQFVPSFIAVWYDVGADPDGFVSGNPNDRMAIASPSGTSWTATIPASDSEIVEGVIVRFLIDVDGLRHYSDGSETSGGGIPWRFRIIYEQTDRVTIRNNIINPKNGDLAYINIVTSKSEQISVTVYDLNGDPVTELFKQKRMPGSNLITWDGKNRRGKIVVPDVYFIVVKVGGKRYVKKVLVVR